MGDNQNTFNLILRGLGLALALVALVFGFIDPGGIANQLRLLGLAVLSLAGAGFIKSDN